MYGNWINETVNIINTQEWMLTRDKKLIQSILISHNYFTIIKVMGSCN